MRDTPDDVEARLFTLYAGLTPGERLRMACSMFDTAVALIKAGILHEQPEITEPKLREAIFRRLYSDCFTQEEMQRIIAYLQQAA
jgi:hypothetical protein